MELQISIIAGLVAGGAYGLFAVLLLLRGKPSSSNRLLALAAGLTAAWSAISSLNGIYEDTWDWMSPLTAILRDAGWFGAILALLRQDHASDLVWRRLSLSAVTVSFVGAIFAVTHLTINTGLGISLGLPAAQFAVGLTGLVLVENLSRNLPNARNWSLKLAVIGLAALFSYNIFLCIPEVLAAMSMTSFQRAQPLVYLVVLPLFVVTAIRNDTLRLQVHSSRNVVFHSATVIFAGILLQGTAVAAYYIRNFGGTPAVMLAIVTSFTSVLAILALVSSHSARSRIRSFINENFFSYKYDYRLEWKRVIETLSEHKESGSPERVLRTLANLLDSPGGVLWVRREGWGQFAPLAHWSLGEQFGPLRSSDPILASFAEKSTVYLELGAAGNSPEVAAWRERFPNAWLAVALHFRDELVGIALLQKPRAARMLDWEDRNLIALTALQLGAHLAHEHASQALADSQQLAEFNNRVTFAIHDLKNTIGQLSLLAHNAERFGEEAEFRTDMLITIRHAVENLQKLIERLREEGVAPSPQESAVEVDICALIMKLVSGKSRLGVRYDRAAERSVYAFMEKPAALEAALEHIVTNAVEASSGTSPVTIGIEKNANQVIISVTDEGTGMTQDFIDQHLFRPLRTTKKEGTGIGAYQARTIIRSMGGDIEVKSKPGEGTVVLLLFPSQNILQKRTTA